MAAIDAAALKHEREQARASTFHDFRDIDGTWNLLRRAELPPDLQPELKRYAEGSVYMSRMLDDDIRTFIQIKTNNPTRFNAIAHGANNAARELESLWKLTQASVWDQLLNVSRWLDDWVYEGQTAHGLAVPRICFKKKVYEEENGRPVSAWPVSVEKTILDGIDFIGDHLNPKVVYYSYSLSAIDCDIKNKKGERPSYDSTGSLGWVSEDLPENFYADNANKKIQVIVRDGEDPIAMCPLPGCDHKKRKITTYICKDGGKESDYEEVETYDSPFKKSSFLLVGGDIRHTERDPHYKFLPSFRVGYDLVQKYNLFMSDLLAIMRRELADESKYINAGSASAETITALAGDEDSGQSNTVERPDLGDRSMPVLPGAVGSYGNPSIDGLMRLLDKTEKEYMMRRPNPALTGQMTLSEVTGTGVVLQVEGAGVLIGGDLKNWDSMIVRIFEESDHAIRFNSYYEPEDQQTRYCVPVSNTGNVVGYRSNAEGDEIYIDAKKCGKVRFIATTSKETPSEATNRKMTAITGKKEGVLTQRQVDEMWDITDPELQEEERFREQVRNFLQPMKMRRVAARLVGISAAVTGVDHGEEPMIDQMPMPEDGGEQTYNTVAANNSRLHAPPVTVAPTGTPTGGSSGLAGT